MTVISYITDETQLGLGLYLQCEKYCFYIVDKNQDQDVRHLLYKNSKFVFVDVLIRA